MSSVMLTVISTVAGIAVGFVTSWWFARAGKRDAEAQRARIERAFAAQRATLGEVQAILQTSLAPVGAGAEVVPPLGSAVSSSAADVLVRASLGALLDEHGEVSVPRLLAELARALPGVAQPSVLASLEELRRAGRVSWPGDDVRKAGVIKVLP